MPAGSPRIDVLPAVSMKSGLEDRNNRRRTVIMCTRTSVVSMKSGLEDRNNQRTPLRGSATAVTSQ